MLDQETTFLIPWCDAYKRIGELLVAFDGKYEKLDKDVEITCSCKRIYPFTQLMNIGTLGIFGTLAILSNGSSDEVLIKLSRTNTNSWTCPYCGAKNITFKWVGTDANELFVFKQSIRVINAIE